MNPDALLTHTLRAHPRGSQITAVMAAALQAVDPYAAVQRALTLRGSQLCLHGQTWNLDEYDRVFLAAFGKAAYPMCLAAEAVLGPRLTAGEAVTKDGHLPPHNQLRRTRLHLAGHPVPDERSLQAAQAVLALLDSAGPRDLILCLISGGGSALLTAPVPEVGLGDLQTLTQLLLRCGAPIQEINTLRKHLDQVKGGRLAQRAAPAPILSLILSDVIGDPLDVIASGPTVPDPSTYADAWGILQRYGLQDALPDGLRIYLQDGLAGKIPDTPKPQDPLFARAQTAIIASLPQAAQAAAQCAQGFGFHTAVLTTCLQGEAAQAGRFMAAIARQVRTFGQPLPAPACLIAGGETTVTVRGDGMGGRNQELVLGAVADLAGLPDTCLISLATDGGDGPTPAAGAAASGESLARAQALGLHPADFLARSDSFAFFSALDDLLLPGPTQTNVNDLTFLFVF